MNEPRSEQPAAVARLASLLLVSGGCALIYQVVWVRELRLVFGATTSASAAVLAIFMAGLGLGNGLLGKRMDATSQPLRIYAWLELGIALFTAITPFLIDAVRAVYVSAGGQAELGSAVATIVRLFATTLILAVPTFLMGGTLPAAALAVASDADIHRRGLAALYGLNTLGAVIGAGLANFYLIEWLGNRGVLWCACGVNLLLAAAAFWYSRRLSELPALKKLERKQPKKQFIEATPSSGLTTVCLTAAIVGFVFFLMELVWYRMLGPILGGTTYTFGLILCVALLGIGLGGGLYSLIGGRLKPSLQLLSLTCALEALLIAIPFWYGDQIALWTQHEQSAGVDSFAGQIWIWFQVAAFVILPAAAVSGFQFPLLIAVAGSGRADVGRHVGWTFAANTAGAIGGSLAGGFWLLPALTAPGLWMAAILCLAAWGVVLAGLSLRGAKTITHRPLLGMSVGFAALSIVATYAEGPTAAWRHSGIGAGRGYLVENAGKNVEQDFLNAKRRQCIWEAEGVESSVAIVAVDSLAFFVNGKSDGNAYLDAGTQIGLGLLGPLFHPQPRTGLVIGLGTGESAGWMADAQGMESVDVVELEPAILHMARECAPLNRNALANPKLHVHINDAREYLLTTSKSYDIIVSEPSNPYRAGIANLYTQEFYRSAADRLSPDGLFLQWLQGYEIDERTVRIVLSTVRSIFPRVQIWRTVERDLVIVCGRSETSLRHTEQSLARWQTDPTIREGLSRAWRIDDLEGLLAHHVCGDKTIEKFLGDEKTPRNTDSRNLLEYAFAKTLGKHTRFSTATLLLLAIDEQDDVPLATGNSAAAKWSAARIAQRRLALHMYSIGEVPSEPRLLAGQRDRAEAWESYLQFHYEAAARTLQKIGVDEVCPIERMIYAHSLAEAGLPVPEKLLAKVKEYNATEAAAIEAIVHVKSRRSVQALEASLRMYEGLRDQPWGNPQLLDAVLHYSVTLAQAQPALAPRLHARLNEPFAMYRLESQRRIACCLVAEHLSVSHAIDALAEMEPHVPWKVGFLKGRARLYAAQRHWLAPRAQSDLAQFEAWARQDRSGTK